jgi:hypothetical protein
MMKLSISEILQKASEMKDEAARINWLRQNNSVALETILRGAFDPSIKWLLPEGNPPYKPNDLVDQHHRLFTEIRKMYLFIEGGNPDLKQLRRESLFVEILETVDPEDAKLLLAVKEKHLPYPGVTRDVIRKAFPGIFQEEVKE